MGEERKVKVRETNMSHIMDTINHTELIELTEINITIK